ncbi:hypothetical protein L6R49_27045 [Myxococcota bacterium]|nr:hypothetical protein [Myxococcota bacterium]
MSKLQRVLRADQVTPVRPLLYLGPDEADLAMAGEPVSTTTNTRVWKAEAEVHHARPISSRQRSTRPFVGGLAQTVRDEVRRRTWALVVEDGALSLLELGGLAPRRLLASEGVLTAQLALNKHSGAPSVVWVTSTGLLLDGHRLDTGDDAPELPSLSFSQAPIGHVVDRPPAFVVVGWRDARTGDCVLSRLEADEGPSGWRQTTTTRLPAPRGLGGPRLAISGDEVLVAVASWGRDGVQQALYRSTDAAGAFCEVPERLDAGTWGDGWQGAPALAAPVVDHRGNFHLPVLLRRGREIMTVNVLPGDAVVEAIEAEAGHRAALSLAPFPKRDDPLPARATPSRFGDGRTDGLGLIMVLMADGRLYASNSQAGGRHFSAPARLNHELPHVAAFAATDCYTSGDRPHTVSMDYLWMEGDERGAPMGPTLHAETWGMPLPEPVVEVSRDGDRVRLRVVQDGFFYEGGTTVAADRPEVGVEALTLHGPREARLRLAGAGDGPVSLTVEAQARLYHHRFVVRC